ncbi:2-polyprenyl-6-methoxyphenol 4-hydroxylase [Spiribacter salinus M19-40]|uniref:2-polyprenyl-6-methoxyphenol 4-hydroxylase n=1 Tax=Spiribacter salinus M19-40 TaxID=1260251 RepID=R4V778_9GAMM|nr:2-octaprenyl-6-methoxyphenyl hydroxylase [Spiribacter salinus]AGM41724.1 2-polyprenyl-6-methoxyphenol 4-hydroxylase [Spiribacter salinus M19-40]
MKTMDFDVLIAGGGLVGASLALALRGSGLQVAVVEPVPAEATQQPSFDDRQTALAPTSRRFFERLGVWDAIESGATPIRQIHVSDRGHGGFTRLRAEEEGLPALGHVAPNRVLGDALQPALAEAATLFCPAEILDTHVLMDGAEADVRPMGRKVRVGTEAGEITLNTRLLVVADGMHSATREALGVGTHARDYGQSAIIANLRTERPHGGVAYERFTPDGPLALLPSRDETVSLVWTLPHDEAETAAQTWDDVTFLAELQAAFGWRLGRLESVGSRSVYPLAAVTAEAFATERAVILGNAAHALHPVAGQGLNLALRDVAALAEALGAVSVDPRVDAPASAIDPGDPEVLNHYAQARQSDYRRTFTFTDGLVRLFSNECLPLVAARNLGLTALDLFPPARRYLLKQATGAAGNVPTLCQSPSPSMERRENQNE